MKNFFSGAVLTKTDLARMAISGAVDRNDSFSRSDSKSAEIPLFDCDGKTAILNTLSISLSHSHFRNSNSADSSSSVSYELKTDTGTIIGTGSSSITYNLFEYKLDGAEKLILKISGSVSGWDYSQGAGSGAWADASGSATAKYIDLSDG